jgi:hypothetical protein
MMKRGHRDLLVVSGRLHHSAHLEDEIRQIERLLLHVEITSEIAAASEVIDLKRYRLVTKKEKVARLIRDGDTERPFLFLFNRN